ncbi:MAG: OmpA family protein [Bacteroidota bacterium]
MRKYFFFCAFLFPWLCCLSQQPKPVVLISGKVLNDRTMQPVEVDVRVVYEILPDGEEAGIARTNPLTGEYKIILPYGKNYGYLALAEGYYSVTKSLDVTNLTEYTEIDEQNLFLAPLKKDQVVILNNVFFKKRTTELMAESNPELNRFAEFLKTNKKIFIEISAHTDNKGEPEKDIELTQQRAQAIADYVIGRGVKADRITIKGYGQKYPIAFNTDKEERQRNNRVEFKIISLEKPK